MKSVGETARRGSHKQEGGGGQSADSRSGRTARPCGLLSSAGLIAMSWRLLGYSGTFNTIKGS